MSRPRTAPHATVLGLVAVGVLLAGCGGDTGGATPAETADSHAEAPHWGYTGESGPTAWADLAPDYAVCGTGTEQSPIDLVDADSSDLTDVAFDYVAAPVRMIDNGHTIQVDVEPGSSIEVDGESYELLQFHLHAPSEHLVDGRPADAELHLVHANADGELAVVGVLITTGSASEAIAPVLDRLPLEPGVETLLDTAVDPAGLLPETRTTYRYDGSLTTPPCTEGVRWFVMTEPVTWSAEQLASFTAVHDGNARPVQEPDGRTAVVDVS